MAKRTTPTEFVGALYDEIEEVIIDRSPVIRGTREEAMADAYAMVKHHQTLPDDGDADRNYGGITEAHAYVLGQRPTGGSMNADIEYVCTEVRSDGMRCFDTQAIDAPVHVRVIWLTPRECHNAVVGTRGTMRYVSGASRGGYLFTAAS